MKTCKKCGEEKGLDCFANQKSGKLGKRSRCRSCLSSQRNEHRANNRESHLKKRRDYYAVSNELAYVNNRNALNPGIAKAACANRKAKSMGLEDRITFTQVHDLFANHGWGCYYCDVQSVDPSVMTLDHVVPLAKGGQNTIQNCVPACAECNSSKGDRTWK